MAAVRAGLKALAGLPKPLFLTVNVSPTTLASTGFRRLLEQSDGERIVVEITEHAPVEDYARLAETLAPLRAQGLRLAVDDAGAGFASLRHIVQLAPDIVKAAIDGRLPQGLGLTRLAELPMDWTAQHRRTGM